MKHMLGWISGHDDRSMSRFRHIDYLLVISYRLDDSEQKAFLPVNMSTKTKQKKKNIAHF